MGQVLVKRAFNETDKDGKAVVVVKELDFTPMKVRYPNGYEGIMKKHIADVEAKRGKLEILGPGTPAPKPEKKEKKIDRDALMKRAIKAKLAEPEELLRLSDAELAELVGE